jgi:multiple antibiotic resistance protein
MVDYLLNALVTLFVVVDPPGMVPIFLALTSGLTTAERASVAKHATTVATLVLVFSALAGQEVLNQLGISLPAFRIAGGLLLFYIAFEMVFAKRSERKSEQTEAMSHEELRNLAVFPIAIPLISGPGAISASILAASRAPSWTGLALFLAGIVAIMAACLGLFLVAERIDRMLGLTGRIVLERLFGMILAALAVQFVADGVKAIAG